MAQGGEMAGNVGTGVVGANPSAAQANDVDQMQNRLDQLKNL